MSVLTRRMMPRSVPILAILWLLIGAGCSSAPRVARQAVESPDVARTSLDEPAAPDPSDFEGPIRATPVSAEEDPDQSAPASGEDQSAVRRTGESLQKRILAPPEQLAAYLNEPPSTRSMPVDPANRDRERRIRAASGRSTGFPGRL